MIRRPPKPSEQRGFARDIETYSFSFYDNGEIVDASCDSRLAALRQFLASAQSGRKMTTANYEMTPREADQFLRALDRTLGDQEVN